MDIGPMNKDLKKPLSLFDYRELIDSMPIDNHAFTINMKAWRKEIQNKSIETLLESSSGPFIINRGDLRAVARSIDTFILLTLMWGYPTKGRGNNINNLLEQKNYDLLKTALIQYKRERSISNITLTTDLKGIESCGISTMSKFLCFLDVKVEGYQSIILDRQIIKVLNNETFKELQSLSHITYSNGTSRYSEYLEVMNDLADDLSIDVERLEMFLFLFGRNLG